MVELPGKPERESVSVQAGSNTLTSVVYTVETANEAVAVSYVDYPSEVSSKDPKEILKAAAGGVVTALQGRLVSSAPLTYLGGEALDFKVESNEGNATARAFLVGDRMYVVQVVRRDKIARPATFERLISTFRFA